MPLFYYVLSHGSRFNEARCSDLDELFSRNIRDALTVTFTGAYSVHGRIILSKLIIHEQGEQHGK